MEVSVSLVWLRIVVAILKLKMEALSYEILNAIIQICCMGISLLKNMMTLCPPTGNENLAWPMHKNPPCSHFSDVNPHGVPVFDHGL